MKKLLSILLVFLLSCGALAEHMGAPYEFRESPVTAARIAPGVTEIAEGAYYYCKELKTLEVPATVTKIGDYAFDHCENLTELTIPDSVREIGECAFNYCMRIASLDLGNGVKTLGSYAFSCCFSLRQATIPQSVTSIGDYAFYNCRALDTLYIYGSVQSIGASALEGCPRLTVYTPATSFAAAYCTQNGIKWVAIEEPEKAETPADLPESTNTTEDKYELFVRGGKAQAYLTRISEIEKNSVYRITRDEILDDFADGGLDLWIKEAYKGLTSDGVVKKISDISQNQELALMKEMIMEMMDAGVETVVDPRVFDAINSAIDVVNNAFEAKDSSKKPSLEIGFEDPSALSFAATVLSTIVDCVNLGIVSHEQKKALIDSLVEYGANMQALERIIHASTGTLRTAAEEIQRDLENAYLESWTSVEQDAVTGLLITGANSIVNIFDFTAWMRGLYRIFTNETSKTVDAEFAFLEYSTTLAEIKNACSSAVSKNDPAAYDLLQLYCTGLLKGFDNTYTYYNSYGRTLTGKLKTDFGVYDKDGILSIIGEQEGKLYSLQQEMESDLR